MPSSGPIQVIPPGLLGFLQLKSSGLNPRQLLDEYQPAIEMRDWLFQANMQDWLTARGGGAPPAIALSNGQTGVRGFSPLVPVVAQDEIWWVENFTVRTGSLVATDIAAAAPVLLTLGAVTSQYVLTDTSADQTTGDADTRVHTASARGFWAPPGSELALMVKANDTATTITWSAYIRFVPMKL